MPVSLSAALAVRETLVAETFPFAKEGLGPPGVSTLQVQGVRLAGGKVVHVEGLNKEGNSAVVVDVDYDMHTLTVSTGPSPSGAKPVFELTTIDLPNNEGCRLSIDYIDNHGLNLTCDVVQTGAGQKSPLKVSFFSGSTTLSGPVTPGAAEMPHVLTQIKDFMSSRREQAPGHGDPGIVAPFAPQMKSTFAKATPIGLGAQPSWVKCLAIGIIAGIVCGVLCAVAGHLLCDEGSAR